MSRRREKINVLIPDGERVLAKFVVNCLSGIKNVKVHVLSTNPKASIRYSRYISSYSEISKPDSELEWLNEITNRIKECNVQVLMPVENELIELISRNEEHFNQITKFFTPPLESFLNSLDKWKFYEFLDKNKLSTPDCFDSLEEVDKAMDKISYPILLKPRIGMGGFGIKKVSDLESLTREFEHSPGLMVQEYIKGFDIDMSVICVHGEIKAYTIQKGYIFSGAKYSAALGVKFLKEDRLYQLVKRMMKLLNWSGYAHIDLIFDEKQRDYKILEINPRAWGSIEASKCVGVNFPHLYILTAMGEAFEIPDYREQSSATNVGLIKVLKSKMANKRRQIEMPDHGHQLKHFLDPINFIHRAYSSKRS